MAKKSLEERVKHLEELWWRIPLGMSGAILILLLILLIPLSAGGNPVASLWFTALAFLGWASLGVLGATAMAFAFPDEEINKVIK